LRIVRLRSLLLDLLGTRRREGLVRGWCEVPEFVFPGETGKPLDENCRPSAKFGHKGSMI